MDGALVTGELNEANDAEGAVQSRSRVDRRTMIKSAAAVGAGAVAWSAPRIETLGFTPAAAATPCIILSPFSFDKNSQSGQNDCPIPAPAPCCELSFGNAGQVERFTFTNPVVNCSQIVIRTITQDCDAGKKNADAGQFGVIIESVTGDGCGVCTVLDAVLVASSGRAVVTSSNDGPLSCPPAGVIGDGVKASFLCEDVPDPTAVVPSSRLAVRITCVSGNPGCVQPPPPPK